jgi:hypothetical protein
MEPFGSMTIVKGEICGSGVFHGRKYSDLIMDKKMLIIIDKKHDMDGFNGVVAGAVYADHIIIIIDIVLHNRLNIN